MRLPIAFALLLSATAVVDCVGNDPTVVAGNGAADGGATEGGAIDDRDAAVGPPDGTKRATMLFVFGGATNKAGNADPVFEAVAAPILADGALGNFTRASTLDVLRRHMTTVVTPDGLVIMAGGEGAAINETPGANFTPYRIDVSTTDGDAPAPWRSAPALASDGRLLAAATYAGGHAYISGGEVEGGEITDRIKVAAVVGSPPALQGWEPTAALPSPAADHGLVALGDQLYVIGGKRSAADTDVVATTQAASIQPDGTLGPWGATGSLPTPLRAFGVVAVGDRAFVVGGNTGTADSPAVYVGKANGASGLEWKETAPLQHARHHLCVVHANGRIYAIGGSVTTSFAAHVEVGEIDANGIKGWTETTPLPTSRMGMGCFVR